MGTIGFIPSREDGPVGHEDAEQSPGAPIEMLVRHLIGALEQERILKDSHDDLLKEVRRYAEHLAQLDPNCNNVQEMGRVVLRLSYAGTAQERLDALTSEAHRLMEAVAEAKRQRRVRWMLWAAAIIAGIWVTGICAASFFSSAQLVWIIGSLFSKPL